MNLQGANSMRAYGYYSIGETDSLHMVAEIAKIPFKVAEPFTVGLMSDLRGDAYGTVRVEGPVKRPANFRVCGDEKWWLLL